MLGTFHCTSHIAAMLRAATVLIDTKRLGIPRREPRRRRRRWCAEHGKDAMLAGKINGPFEPIEVIDIFGGFERAPGKLAHTNDV
jgi:hypothetical protein